MQVYISDANQCVGVVVGGGVVVVLPLGVYLPINVRSVGVRIGWSPGEGRSKFFLLVTAAHRRPKRPPMMALWHCHSVTVSPTPSSRLGQLLHNYRGFTQSSY